jgi:protein subunit release factor B
MESIRNPATQSKIIIIYYVQQQKKRKKKNEESSTSGIRRISPCHNFHPHAKKENGKKRKVIQTTIPRAQRGKEKVSLTTNETLSVVCLI